MAAGGFGIKAATITPEGADDVGSPNRLIREAIDGKVIVRTGRRIPGVSRVAGIHHPISMIPAVAALLHCAGEAGVEAAHRPSRALYEAVFGAAAAGYPHS